MMSQDDQTCSGENVETSPCSGENVETSPCSGENVETSPCADEDVSPCASEDVLPCVGDDVQILPCVSDNDESVTPGVSSEAANQSAQTDEANDNRQYRITVAANQGGRRYMEDRVQIECKRLPNGQLDYVYLAVYDGHGGAEASEFVRLHLLKNIESQNGFNGNDDEMLQAIRNGFIQTHLAMWNVVDKWPLTPSGYPSTAGTTASCVFIRRGKVYTGHVGDSAIILGREEDNQLKGCRLTVDHKPDSYGEEQRINRAGGMVMRKAGVMRVVWIRPVRGISQYARRPGATESIAFLAVARALGDLWSYNNNTKQFVVSPEPDVNCFELNVNDKFLVLASDGLTNVLEAQTIAEQVVHYETLKQKRSGRLPNHSRWLLCHALKSWGQMRADNISVITVYFDAGELDSIASYTLMDENKNANLNELLTDCSDSTVVVSSNTCRQLRTLPLILFFSGAVDQNFSEEVNYKGPGFMRYVRVTHQPIPQVLRRPPVDHFNILRNFSSTYTSSMQWGSRKSFLQKPLDEIEPSASTVVGEHQNSSLDQNVLNRETNDKNSSLQLPHESNDNSKSKSLDEDSDIMAQCSSQSDVSATASSTESALRKELLGFRKRKRPCNSSGENVENIERLSENIEINSSPSSQICEQTSADACKDTIKDRKIIVPRRSMRLRKCGISGPSQSCQGEVGAGDLMDSNKILASFKQGSACALSPSVMLAALRTPDRLSRSSENDYLARDVSLSSLRLVRPSNVNCNNLSASTAKRFKQSVAAPDVCLGAEICSDNSSSTSENKIPVRSRVWGFLASFLSGRTP